MSAANGEPVLGLARGTVRLAPHDARWAELYRDEEARLRAALEGVLVDVQHFGSTSIPGIRAKPILDILAGVPDRDDVFARRPQLQALGYGYVPGAGVPGHHVFGKGEPRTHLLHVVEHGSRAWTENLWFRDRLRADPALAAEYDALKLRLAEAHPGDRARYTEEKGAFVQRIRREAPAPEGAGAGAGHPDPASPPPRELLADDAIELRLIRILGPHDAEARPENERFLSRVRECRFAIHRRSDGLRVGRIHLRVTRDEQVVRAAGHSGYAVDEEHRRNGYATRAIRLIVGLARHWDVLPLWVLIEPHNAASRGAVERAGLVLADTVDSAPELMALGMGPRVCRYTTPG